MPKLQSLPDRCLLWPLVGGIFGPVEEIAVRWSDVPVTIQDSENKPVTVDATAVVGQEIELGSHLARVTNPGVLYIVRPFTSVPPIAGVPSVRTVGLTKVVP